MNRGVLRSIVYYLAGLGLTALSYLMVDNTYAHGPSLYHMVILLTFLGGVGWLIFAAVRYIFVKRSKDLLGIVVTNLLMSLGFVLFVAYILRDSQGDDHSEVKEHNISVKESGDTTTMYDGGNIIYIKVKDSVLINFIDSTRSTRVK